MRRRWQAATNAEISASRWPRLACRPPDRIAVLYDSVWFKDRRSVSAADEFGPATQRHPQSGATRNTPPFGIDRRDHRNPQNPLGPSVNSAVNSARRDRACLSLGSRTPARPSDGNDRPGLPSRNLWDPLESLLLH